MQMDQNQENEIIFRILNGERNTYAVLVDKYKTPIFNLAYRMTGSHEDAADLAQETFIQAFKNLKSFNRERRFFPWLYTIALNITRNHLKRRALFRLAQQNKAVKDVSGEGKRNPEGDMMADEQAKSLAVNLKKLPLEQRETIIMRFYQGLSFEEIAAILRCSESAVKMRVYRGLEKLKLLLQRN